MRALILATLFLPAIAVAQVERPVRQTICVPAAEQKAANSTLEALGYGPSTFTIPLIPKLSLDATPTTIYCCDWRMTEADDTTVRAALTAGGFHATYDKRDSPECRTGKPTFAEAIDARGNRVKPSPNALGASP
jgi:hypothetical protein